MVVGSGAVLPQWSAGGAVLVSIQILNAALFLLIRWMAERRVSPSSLDTIGEKKESHGV